MNKIHLHGHDFAILEQAENRVLDYGFLNLTFDNPPRRDVVLLPRNGYIVIAFKTDNPGLLRCTSFDSLRALSSNLQDHGLCTVTLQHMQLKDWLCKYLKDRRPPTQYGRGIPRRQSLPPGRRARNGIIGKQTATTGGLVKMVVVQGTNQTLRSLSRMIPVFDHSEAEEWMYF